MAQLSGASDEQLANHFVNYLFDQYHGSRHVRRIASGVGLIVLGIERAAGETWRVPRTRQLRFEFAGRQFKAKYNHRAGPRGGVDIVEEFPGRGAPEGQTVVSITNLQDAERFYAEAPSLLEEFVRNKYTGLTANVSASMKKRSVRKIPLLKRSIGRVVSSAR